jgi:uncharacterized membrane protein YhaH (DUF805 family)
MLVAWNYIAFFVILPRARDCGLPFLWALLALVPLFFPFLAVTLMFRPAPYQFSELRDQTSSGNPTQ